MRITWVGRGYLDRKSMILRSLKTYGYIDSKTKSYWLLRRFLLLFIFHAFWPYKAAFLCFLIFWSYKAGLLCSLAFWPYKVGLPCFLICFPIYWELLGLCPRADRVPTIPWIITECLAIYFVVLDFFCSDRINHPTRFICKMQWRHWHPTVQYLPRPARRAIGQQTFLVPNWGYDPKKALN